MKPTPFLLTGSLNFSNYDILISRDKVCINLEVMFVDW